MKRLVPILAFIVLPLVALAQPAGELFRSAEGKYSVRFPGKPKETRQTARSPLGELVVFNATYVTNENNVYLASYTDLPEEATRGGNRDTLYDGVREGLKGKEGSVVADEKVEIGADKLPGRELLLKKGDQSVRVRVVLKDNRLYQVIAVGTDAFATGNTVAGFLESFDVLK